jgi:hypothetical protein
MVRMAVMLERLQPRTRKLRAVSTVLKPFAVSAGPDITIRAARMNVQGIRATPLADESLKGPPLAMYL